MMSIPLGPLALPAAPLLLLLSTWFAAWLADRLAVAGLLLCSAGTASLAALAPRAA